MKAKGNGTPEQCVQNLISLYRHEVPMERLKGVDGSLVDKNTLAVAPELKAQCEWLIDTYEPRAVLKDIKRAVIDGAGNTGLTAEIEKYGT